MFCEIIEIGAWTGRELFLLFRSVVAASSTPDSLAGRITDSEGRPIENARVDIWTAHPKVGVGTL